jgi:hypothetical protein
MVKMIGMRRRQRSRYGRVINEMAWYLCNAGRRFLRHLPDRDGRGREGVQEGHRAANKSFGAERRYFAGREKKVSLG